MQSFMAHAYLIYIREPSNPYMKISKLIDRAKANDHDALKTIYETYFPILKDVCFKITKADDDTINDIVQDAFVIAFGSLDKLKDPSKFGSWASVIVKNLSIRHLQKAQKSQFISLSSILEEEIDANADVLPDGALEEKELQALIESLPEGYGTIFKLAVVEGYSHKEIAQRLGIQPHSSSSQLARAKALLRKMINKRTLTFIALLTICIPLCKRLFYKKHTPGSTPTHMAENKTKSKNTPKGEYSERPASTSVPPHRQADRTQSDLHLAYSRRSKDTVSERYEQEGIDSSKYVAIAAPNDSLRHQVSPTAPPRANEAHTENYLAFNEAKGKSKWQLFATGIFGAAMSQNVGKQFVNNLDPPFIDSPSPIIPDKITTWKDYELYLQEKTGGGTTGTADTLALLTIAMHNSGKIVEQEHHDKPITFGLYAAKDIGFNFTVETGLQYSLLKSQFKLGEGSYYVSRLQKAHYLGIPLRASYRWLNAKRWTAYTSAGVQLNIPLYGKANERYVTGSAVPYIGNSHFTPPVQWTVGTGVGLQYNITPNWGIYFEPTINWHIPNGSTIHTIWTEQPFTVTAPFGIRFTW